MEKKEGKNPYLEDINSRIIYEGTEINDFTDLYDIVKFTKDKPKFNLTTMNGFKTHFDLIIKKKVMSINARNRRK